VGSRHRSTPWHTRLEARFLLFVTLVTAVSVGAMLVAATRVITSSTLERDHRDQDAAKTAFDRLIERQGTFATTQSRLITELPILRAHLSDERLASDEATIQVLARQYRESLASDFLLVADARGRWLGRANWPAGPAPDWRVLAQQSGPGDGQGRRTIVTVADGLYLVVIEPARFVDELLGWLVVGYRLDDGFATELAQITHADVNFLSGHRLLASSLDPRRRHALALLIAGAPIASSQRLQLGSSRYSSREYLLSAAATGDSSSSLLLLRDWLPTQNLIDGVQSQLLWIGVVAFTLAVAGSFVFSRRAARPLRDIAAAAHEITQGDWTRRVPVRGSTEAATMATAFNEMTTTLTALNADLASAKVKAEDANRAKDEFLANVNHEIRTPLNGIIGMTKLALDTTLNDEQRDFLQTVDSSASALLSIVNDVLDFAKIDAGGVTLALAPFNVHDCLTQSLKMLSGQTAQKHLRLACAIDPGLPRALVGDEGRLRQVLLNLLGNAVKFTAAGTVSLRASAEIEPDGSALMYVVVSDTGIGIPKDKHELIFKPFVQADGSTTRQYGGTGLGLTISSRLVALMGGRMWVESEPGVGTQFHFTARLAVPCDERSIRTVA